MDLPGQHSSDFKDQLEPAKKWLQKVFKIGGAWRMRKMALEDPDLRPLWGPI